MVGGAPCYVDRVQGAKAELGDTKGKMVSAPEHSGGRGEHEQRMYKEEQTEKYGAIHTERTSPQRSNSSTAFILNTLPLVVFD